MSATIGSGPLSSLSPDRMTRRFPDNGPVSEIQLVQQAKAGSIAAFGQLVRRHQNRVAALALALTRSWDDAEDLTQEVFIRAWTRLDTLNDAAALGAWLRRITYRTCLNWLQSRGASEGRRMADYQDVSDLVADESPERPLEVQQTADRVAAALLALSPRYRIPLTLFYFRDLQTEEIALFLDVPVGTVKSLLSRGRTLLHQTLNLDGELPDTEVFSLVRDALQNQKLPEDFAELVAATISAIEAGDLERLEALIAHRPELVNEPSGPSKWPPLHFASSSGRQAVAELLLRRGADAQQRCEGDRATALHFAAEGGHLEIVKLLVEAGCDVNQSDNDHERGPLGWAVALHAYQPKVAEYLLSHGAQHDIFTAVAMNDAQTVRRLVNEDPSQLAERMSKNEAQQTPLHFAVRRARIQMVDLLLELGADPSLADADGLLPIELAIALDNREVRLQMLERLRPPGLRGDLLLAIGSGDSAKVAELVHVDSSTIVRGAADADLLGLAAETENAAACRVLLGAGADPDARALGPLSYTALMIASVRGNRAIVEMLLQAGADMNAKDADVHATPAVHAAWNGHIEMLEVYRAHRPVTGPDAEWAQTLLDYCDRGSKGEFEQWGCRCSRAQWAALGTRLRELGIEAGQSTKHH